MMCADRVPKISELIDQRGLSRFQLVTRLLCGLVLMLDGFATQSIGFLAPSIAKSLHLALRSFGPVFAAALFGGRPLGPLLGGIISSVMLPRWGWRSVFWAGGILPLLVALFLIRLLPESLRFLSLRLARRTEIDRIVAKIAPEVKQFELDASTAKNQGQTDGAPVIHLFTEGRAAGTILLWVPFFMNLLMLYFIVNWLPALLRETHMPLTAGLLAVSLFSLGGILGSFLQGYAM